MKKIILFCVLTLVLLIISGCKAAEEAAPEEPIAVEEPVKEEVIQETVIPETAIQGPTSETLSELRCVDSKIEAVITNTQDSSVELAKDIKIMINGLLVVDPECDSLILAPGASTFCSDLSGHLAIREGKTNTVKINMLHESVVDYVECFVEE